MVGEVDDCLLEFLGGHLAVGHDGARVGDYPLHHLLELHQSLDAVVDDEHLAVARHLEVYSLGQQVVGQGVDRGQDGVAVGWRGGYRREVAGPHEGELQGAGYGSGRHRQGVHRDFELLQFLLDGHAEFLLLVNHQQAEVFEPDILAYKPVGADQDVDFAVGEVFEDFLDLFGGAGAR